MEALLQLRDVDVSRADVIGECNIRSRSGGLTHDEARAGDACR